MSTLGGAASSVVDLKPSAYELKHSKTLHVRGGFLLSNYESTAIRLDQIALVTIDSLTDEHSAPMWVLITPVGSTQPMCFCKLDNMTTDMACNVLCQLLDQLEGPYDTITLRYNVENCNFE